MVKVHRLYAALVAASTLTFSATTWAALDPNLIVSGPFNRTIAGKPYTNAYSLTVIQQPQDSGSDTVYFNKVDESLGLFKWEGTSQLTYITMTLAADINLYQVEEGQTFSVAGVQAGQFPSVRSSSGLTVPLTGSLVAAKSFYLAVRTEGNTVSNDPGWRDALGWMRFTNTTADGLKMTDSFLAYDASSIVIGVSSVPETSTLGMSVAGLLGLVIARRLSTKH